MRPSRSSNHQRNTTPGAMATAYLPLLSCTVGAREALIAACILPFKYTRSVLSTSRTIESCNQTLSMAPVNQILPYRTWRLGEYQQSRHRGRVGKRKGKSPDVRGAERVNRKRPLVAPKAIASAERRRCDRAGIAV